MLVLITHGPPPPPSRLSVFDPFSRGFWHMLKFENEHNISGLVFCFKFMEV